MDKQMTLGDSWPPKFMLDQEKILELLTGDRFYSNASAALREVILNALDAVHRRRVDKPDHQASIRVIFDPSLPMLICEDNGDGMDHQKVIDLFATIGASASALGDSGQDVIGEFGIGVISYFMAADEFEIETFDGQDGPIGLKFRKNMFAGSQAEPIEAARIERGTTVRLRIRDDDTYELLRTEYSHWCRRVDGLTAIERPGGTLILQGENITPHAPTVDVQIPDGIEEAFLSPISTVHAWEQMSGASTITILYRGVFVQDYVADKLWGMTGSIFVNPKHFKPRLNREGFIGSEFQAEISAFLKTAHPAVLGKLIDVLSQALSEGTLSEWTTRRWATLWLSIPRTPEYQETADKWDSVFRRIPAFEVSRGDSWIPATVDHLATIKEPIYMAPHRLKGENDVVLTALRLLRQTDRPVLRGLERDRGWLEGARNYFSTTADLISTQFKGEIPELKYVSQEAEGVLENLGAVQVLFGGDRPVELVALGEGSPPVLQLKKRLLINTKVDSGRLLISRALELNRGRKGLVEAAIEITPESLQQVANFARTESSNEKDILGLVKRRFIRSIIE